MSGETSEIESRFFPPIKLSPHKSYFLGLVELLTFNSIPNIDEDNNQFKIFNTEKLEVNGIFYSDSKFLQNISKLKLVPLTCKIDLWKNF